jgi:hypothetical protein
MVIKRQKEFGNKENKASKKKWESTIARDNKGPGNKNLSKFRKENRALIHETYPGSEDFILFNVDDSINLRSAYKYPEVKKPKKSTMRPIIKHRKTIMKKVRENRRLIDALRK